MQTFCVGDVVYRHGDVLLKKHDAQASGRFVSAAILHTGQNHSHKLKGGAFRVQEKDGVKILEVKKQTTLGHDEHGPIKVAPGVYMVDIQLEYDHFLEESRKVID